MNENRKIAINTIILTIKLIIKELFRTYSYIILIKK